LFSISGLTRFKEVSLANAQAYEPVLTVKDVAGLLKFSEMTILRRANQGVLPGAKIGRQWRFATDQIMELVRHPEKLGHVAKEAT